VEEDAYRDAAPGGEVEQQRAVGHGRGGVIEPVSKVLRGAEGGGAQRGALHAGHRAPGPYGDASLLFLFFNSKARWR